MNSTRNKMIEKLFPDKRVRDVITAVMKNTNAHAESMSTNYSFLNSEKNQIYTSVGQLCFGSLYPSFRSHYSNSKVSARAKFVKYIPNYSSKCTSQTGLRWIELGQELGILDDEVTPQHIYTNGITVDMTNKKLTLGELYLKLTFMRWLREAPILINNVINLVDNAGRDFWAAVTYCHGVNMSRVDHSLLPFSKGYATSGHLNSIEKDLGLVIRLHEIAASPRATDTRTVRDALDKGSSFSWRWQSDVVKPKMNLPLKDRLMLLSSDVLPLIYTGSVDKASKMIKELERTSAYVRFE